MGNMKRTVVDDLVQGNAGRREWLEGEHPEDEWRAMLSGAANDLDKALAIQRDQEQQLEEQAHRLPQAIRRAKEEPHDA